MKLVNLCLGGEGINYVDRINFRVPNSTLIIDLPEKLSVEDLKKYNLYYLDAPGSVNKPFQTMRTGSLEVDEENRIVTQVPIYEDLPWKTVEKNLMYELEQTKKHEKENGISHAGIFYGASGALKDSALISLSEEVVSIIDFHIENEVYGKDLCFGTDNFIRFNTKEDALYYRKKYIDTVLRFKHEQAVVFSDINLALLNKDIEDARKAWLNSHDFNVKWHGV